MVAGDVRPDDEHSRQNGPFIDTLSDRASIDHPKVAPGHSTASDADLVLASAAAKSHPGGTVRIPANPGTK